MIFRHKKVTPTGLKIHPTIFGHWSEETDEDEKIKIFAGIWSKNYGYETVKRRVERKLKGSQKLGG